MHIKFTRTIETRPGVDEISLEDIIINEGEKREPFMILYRMNFGYPILSPDLELVIPSRKIYGWDELADNNIDKHLSIHKQDPDICIVVKYDGNILDNLVQWRYLHKKDYVMALEPCNNKVKGVDYESRYGSLKFIEPGECVKIKLDITFLSSLPAIVAQKESFERGCTWRLNT